MAMTGVSKGDVTQKIQLFGEGDSFLFLDADGFAPLQPAEFLMPSGEPAALPTVTPAWTDHADHDPGLEAAWMEWAFAAD